MPTPSAQKTTAYRYAVYAVPDTDHPLWRMSADWLGRDAARNRDLAQVALPGWAPERFFALTAEARRYGFHGTLKAPFRLADGIPEGALLDAVQRYSAKRSIPPISLAVDDGLGFLALRPVGDSLPLTRLADDCVRDFDRFRAPLTTSDIQRRLATGLSERQHALMLEWGYPYVLEEFRFHMTLADRCRDPDEQKALLSAAATCFREVLEKPVPLRVALFAEPRPGGAFQMIESMVASGEPAAFDERDIAF
jgi:hypothetical protein